MLSRLLTALVALLMLLPLAQSQRSRCTRNVRCPCGFSSGGVTQDYFCNYANRDPNCCTNSRIPPITVPLSSQPDQSQFRNTLRSLSPQTYQPSLSLEGIPLETSNDALSPPQNYKSVEEEAASDDDQMPALENSITEHVGTDTTPSDTKFSVPTVSTPPKDMPSAPEVMPSTDQPSGSDESVANLTRDHASIFSSRIYGGGPSTALKNAWLVFITFEERTPGSGTPICGGALISSLFVLTTAHCFFELDGAGRRVKKLDLGRFDLNNIGEQGSFSRRANAYFVHPGYNPYTRDQVDDIALILMSAAAPIEGSGVFPVFLPRENESPYRFDDLWARVAGWGGQGPRQSFNPTVRETCMQVKQECCEHHFRNFVPFKQMCFLGPYYTDICAGDSGSPFVVQGYEGPTVIALVSYGTLECGNNKPTVNTAVQYYVPWIRSVVQVYDPSYDFHGKRNIRYIELTCDEFPCNY